jgi:hypothetical protein
VRPRIYTAQRKYRGIGAADFFVAPNGEEMVVIVTGKGTSDAFSSWRVGLE